MEIKFEKILIATDGSMRVTRAIDVAIAFAKLTGAKLYAVYVVDTQHIEHPIRGLPGTDVVQLMHKRGEEAIKKVKLEAELKNVEFEGAVIEGYPAEAIIEFALEKKVDLIVMGTLGRTGLNRFLIGSVAEKVVRSSPIPVLTVKAIK